MNIEQQIQDALRVEIEKQARALVKKAMVRVLKSAKANSAVLAGVEKKDHATETRTQRLVASCMSDDVAMRIPSGDEPYLLK